MSELIASEFDWTAAHQKIRIPEGVYGARGKGIQGPTRVRPWMRWSLIIEFQLLEPRVELVTFFNFGQGDAPKISNNGLYAKAWRLAQGRQPERGEPMYPDVFLNPDLLFQVRVEDSVITANHRVKAEQDIYSRVTSVLSVQRAGQYMEAS